MRTVERLSTLLLLGLACGCGRSQANAPPAVHAMPATSASAGGAEASTSGNGAAVTTGDSQPASQTLGAPLVADTRKKVAVLELSGLGISDITKNLEQYLRNSIGTIDGFAVLSAVDVQMALGDPKNKAVAKCGGGPDCARQVGKLVGAHIVVIGSISALGDSFSLNLRALEVNKKGELARYQASVSGRDRLIPEVRLASYQLIAPDRIRGWLMIEVAVPGVAVEVDGQPVGTTPLAHPVENLTPGAHVVVLKRPGYKPFEQEFTIKPFEPTRLKIALE